MMSARNQREFATAPLGLLRKISQVLLFSVVAMLPIWASGLSSWRAVVYLSLFVALTYLVNFTKFKLSTPIAGLCALVYGCFLLVIERASFNNSLIKIIIVMWLVLVTLIVSRKKVRKVVATNIIVFGVLLLFLEIPFRLLTDSQSSSHFQNLEVFRNSRNDGPDAGSEPVTMNAKGLRITTDQPSTPKGRVLIFGGSTTFCREVSDRLTYPSELQRILNDGNSGLLVENYGKSAATATDRLKVLKSIDDLGENDIIIFYVGVNESGVGFAQRDSPVRLITKLPELGNGLKNISQYSRIADILFRKFVFGGIEISESSKLKAETDFRKAMQDAESFTTKAGAKFVPVLQANLFTRNSPSDYDQTLSRMYGSELGIVMHDMYERLLPIMSAYENFGDARAVMDNLERSPYYDWMHIDSRGNRRIAYFLNGLLLDKGLIE